MSQHSAPDAAIQRVLEEELRPPIYLTPEEVEGGWRELFPELAAALGAPFPIFGRSDEQVVTWGYPVLLSDGTRRLQSEVDRLVELELDYRLQLLQVPSADKRKLMGQRERYRRVIAAIVENTLVNDYGRGLLEVFLLFHSADIQRAVAQVPRLLQQQAAVASRSLGDELRLGIAEVFADLIQRAAVAAVDSLKRLARATLAPRLSPLLGVLCQDRLLLTEIRPPEDPRQLTAYLRARFRQHGEQLLPTLDRVAERLHDVVARQPELGEVLRLITGSEVFRADAKVLLEPRLLEALRHSGLAVTLELPVATLETARELGLRLKCYELLWALRRRVLRMERRDDQLILAGASSATPIAPTTRPFDFTAPSVVSSTVRRFGLVYDLTNFTEQLQTVRKKGPSEEGRALQFMFLFQGQLEEIRERRRLTFEKFLGDGAFYTSRRGLRVLGAACEIRQLYRSLRHSGFPFDQGLRIAMNFGSYQLLPMRARAAGGQRFEFFGPGIVELARLTTGKSTREVEQIAELLVHSGYEPARVEEFLAPLIRARAGREEAAERRHGATLDSHGELINEGIVLTVPFLEQVEAEVELRRVAVVREGGLAWALFEIEPDDPRSLWVGLRYMGVARLKGLEPCELVEAAVWTERPDDAEERPWTRPLLNLLRELTVVSEPEPERELHGNIAEDLVVLSYHGPGGVRQWIFGEYRVSDDVMLHAINIPIDAVGLEDDSAVEIWLLQHRFELARIYESLRRDTSGVSTPLAPLRGRAGYVACYLSAPHKGPQ